MKRISKKLENEIVYEIGELGFHEPNMSKDNIIKSLKSTFPNVTKENLNSILKKVI